MKNNKIIIFTILSLVLISFANASWVDRFDYGTPTNSSWVTSATPTFNFTIDGNRTTYGEVNLTVQGIVVYSFSNLVNGTEIHHTTGTYIDDTTADGVTWSLSVCGDSGEPGVCEDSVGDMTFGVDSNVPNITGLYPLDQRWSITEDNLFNFTGDDVNEDSIELYLTTNESAMKSAADRISVSNDTLYSYGSTIGSGDNNFTLANLNGTYYWDIKFNDSANNIAYASGADTTYFTLWVDSEDPVVTGEPAATATTTDNNFYFNGTCDDMNPDIMYFNLDGVVNYSVSYTTGTKEEMPRVTLSDAVHEYNVSCTDDAGNVGYSTTYSLTVDATDPIVTINNVNDTWETDETLSINLTYSDTFTDSCDVYANWGTPGSQTLSLNESNLSVGALTGDILVDINIADTVSGTPYYWYVVCNDTAGNTATTDYQALNVDTVLPTGLNLVNYSSTFGGGASNYTFALDLINGSTGTELYLPFAWENTSHMETNFDKFTIQFDDNADFSSPEIEMDISSELLNYSRLDTALTPDTTYYYNLTVYDEAGNYNSTDNIFQYDTKSAGASLAVGYNYLSIWRDDDGQNGVYTVTNLSKELGSTIDTISLYLSNSTWLTYDSDTPSINPDSELIRGTPIILYADSVTAWGGNRYYDVTGNVTQYGINMTNSSSSPWHLIPMLNVAGMNFQALETAFGNVSGGFASQDGDNEINITDVDGENTIPAFSYVNSTQYYSYFPTWGEPNNETFINYGETFWVETNRNVINVCYNYTLAQGGCHNMAF